MTTATQTPPPAAPTPAVALMTAEEFMALPDDGRHLELVRGVIVEMSRPNFQHGVVCNRVGRALGNYVDDHGLGWVLSNDSGVITRRGPDTVRGPDVAYFSYAQVPKDQPPDGYPTVPPDLVFEVRSPGDRWAAIHLKVGEYLDTGVRVVCVLDPAVNVINVFTQDGTRGVLSVGDDLTLPELFPDFRVPVGRFFG